MNSLICTVCIDVGFRYSCKGFVRLYILASGQTDRWPKLSDSAGLSVITQAYSQIVLVAVGVGLPEYRTEPLAVRYRNSIFRVKTHLPRNESLEKSKKDLHLAGSLHSARVPDFLLV